MNRHQSDESNRNEQCLVEAPCRRFRPTSGVRHHRSRRGSSLVQAVITMTVMSVLMIIVANALFSMYRQQTVMVERSFQTSTWLRLTRDFRQDVHASESIRQSGDNSHLEMLLPDSRVVWVADGTSVRRIVPADDSVRAGDRTTLRSLPGESYTFADCTVRLELSSGDSDSEPIASLEVEPLPVPDGRTVSSQFVAVTAGLDHRFAARSTGEIQP